MSNITVKRRPVSQPIESIEWAVKDGESYSAHFTTTRDCVGKALYLRRAGYHPSVRIPINDALELLDLLKEFVKQEGTA